MKSITAAEAQQQFADVLDLVADHPVTITRNGRAIGVIVSPDLFHKLSEPNASHLFVSDDVTPARLTVRQLVSIGDAPSDRAAALSQELRELRQDRL